jgi:hypothetical protein
MNPINTMILKDISSSVSDSVETSVGLAWNDDSKKLVELKFNYYSSSQIVAIDMPTARELMNQLRAILPPNYVDL